MIVLKKDKNKEREKMEDEFYNLLHQDITENDVYSNPHIFKILSEPSLGKVLLFISFYPFKLIDFLII